MFTKRGDIKGAVYQKSSSDSKIVYLEKELFTKEGEDDEDLEQIVEEQITEASPKFRWYFFPLALIVQVLFFGGLLVVKLVRKITAIAFFMAIFIFLGVLLLISGFDLGRWEKKVRKMSG